MLTFADMSNEVAPWESDGDGGEYIDIADVCGSAWWGALEGVARSINCETCRNHAVMLISGMHDLVNMHLGKPIFDRENFIAVAATYAHEVEKLGESFHAQQQTIRITGKCDDAECAIKVKGTGKTAEAVVSPAGLADAIAGVRRKLDEQSAAGSPLTFAMGPNGVSRYEFEFAIVELGQVIPSHNPFTFELNPEYPQELQPRLRDRAATRLQVEKIAANLEPDSLLVDFRALDRGAPIVGKDLVVESGNGRVMALKRAATEYPDGFLFYTAKLRDVATLYGSDAGQVDRLRQPVLVRVRISDVDRAQFAQEANTSAAIGMSAIERGRVDAEKITIEMLGSLDVGENESIEDAIRASRNRAVVTQFLSKVSDTDRAQLVDADGRLNQDGVRRITLGVFMSAFESGDVGVALAEMAFESVDLEVRNVVNAVARALGPLATAEAMARSNQRSPGLSISDDLGKAIQTFAGIKRTPGMTVEKYLNQGQLFERELDDFEEEVLQTIDGNSRSAKRLGAIFRTYAQGVIDAPPPDQGRLLDVAELDKPALWAEAMRRSDQEPQPAMFQTWWSNQGRMAQRGPLIGNDPAIVFPTVEAAERVAKGLQAGDADWEYRVIPDPKGSGRAIVKVYDKEGELLGPVAVGMAAAKSTAPPSGQDTLYQDVQALVDEVLAEGVGVAR